MKSTVSLITLLSLTLLLAGVGTAVASPPEIECVIEGIAVTDPSPWTLEIRHIDATAAELDVGYSLLYPFSGNICMETGGDRYPVEFPAREPIETVIVPRDKVESILETEQSALVLSEEVSLGLGESDCCRLKLRSKKAAQYELVLWLDAYDNLTMSITPTSLDYEPVTVRFRSREHLIFSSGADEGSMMLTLAKAARF